MSSTIEIAIEELHKGFALLNDHMFQSSLPLPAILIQNQGTRTRNILGWCTIDKIWADKEKTIQLFEINITAEYLNRNVTDIMATMLHEMVHLYCSVQKIQDTSRSGSYHNKRYKEQAERFGLEVTFDKKIGWAYTTLKPDTQALIESFHLNEAAFKIKRYTWGQMEEEDGEGEEEPKRKSPKRFWRCPTENCLNHKLTIKAKVRTTLDVICGKCNQRFVLVEENVDEDEDI